VEATINQTLFGDCRESMRPLIAERTAQLSISL